VLPAIGADLPEAEQARAVANQILGETKLVLEGALSSGQPAAALGVCASVAQNIARRHEQEGWRVRRVSEKVRNPADTPDADELAVLRAWQNAKHAGHLPPDAEHQQILSEVGHNHPIPRAGTRLRRSQDSSFPFGPFWHLRCTVCLWRYQRPEGGATSKGGSVNTEKTTGRVQGTAS